ncbi:hypothetical protein WDU94_009397 [Cyamophila willieti]
MESSLRCTVKANIIVSESSSASAGSVLNLSPTRHTGDTGGEINTNMADSEEEYVNVDEITDSEDSEEALDLSIKLKLSNRDLRREREREIEPSTCTGDEVACKYSPPLYPLYPLPPCCYPYSWNYCLPSPPTSASIFVEKPLPRKQHLPLDFTNYTHDRPDSFHMYSSFNMYKIHSY